MNKKWWKAAFIRAVKTTAQTTLAVAGTSLTGVFDPMIWQALSVSLLAGILSLLTSIAYGLPKIGESED